MKLAILGGKLANGQVVTVEVNGQITDVRTPDRNTIPAEHYRDVGYTIIDARGKYVFPGFIDPHVHDRCPGGNHKEDWNHLLQAATLGGVTTVCTMPNTDPPITTFEALHNKMLAMGSTEIQHHIWFGATPDNTAEIIEAATRRCVIGVKVYMGSSTGNLLVAEDHQIRRVFQTCAENGLLVAVHAEDELLMQQKIRRKRAPIKVEHHCQIRDTEVEVSAIKRALELQRQTLARVWFCHVSTPEGLILIHRARERGATVYAEACPHYAWLDNGRLRGQNGGYYKMNPALRSPAQVAEYRQLICRADELFVDVIGTDHAPHTREEKSPDRVYHGIPSGVPGIQTSAQLMWTFVEEGIMKPERFLELMCTNASKALRIGTGSLEKGSPADLVIFDPKKEIEIRDADQRSKCGWTPFAGMHTVGAVERVISNGKILL